MKSTKRVSIFYIIYFSLIVLFVAGLFTGLYYLKNYLKGFEDSRPIHTVEAVVDEYFLSEDKTVLLEKSAFEIPEFSSENDVIEYLDTVIVEEDVQFYSIGGDDKTLLYSVVSNNLKIATVTIELLDEPNEGGFPVYELSDISLTIGGSAGVSIKAPVGYTVYVNGHEITDEFIFGEPEETESCNHMYGDAVGVKYVTYKLTGIFGAPDIAAKDSYGTPAENITADDNGVFYNIGINYSEMPEELEARILKASECYAAYMQKDMAFGGVAAYVDRTSELYTNLRTSAVKWATDHNGYKIVDPEVTEFYYYDDNTFSCRVRFVHLLLGRNGNNFENEFDMTFYCRNINGKYMIYDSHVN